MGWVAWFAWHIGLLTRAPTARDLKGGLVKRHRRKGGQIATRRDRRRRAILFIWE